MAAPIAAPVGRAAVTALVAVVACLAGPGPARAQDTWPSRPIRVVVGYPAGGPADIAARVVTERIAAQLERPAIVENRPGAGGAIATDAVAAAAPDGHTVLLSGLHVAIAQALSLAVRYDTVRSFAPVARFATVPSGLFVAARSPLATLSEAIDAARAKPGVLTYASGGTGTPSHLAMEWLKQRTKLDLRHVPYKGTPPAVTDLIGGQVDLLFTSIAGPIEQVRAGRLRLLAVSAPARLEALPQVPAIAELVPGFAFETWLGFAVPRGTPEPIVERLAAEVERALRDPATAERMRAAGLAPDFVGPRALAPRVADEAAAIARLVKDEGIRAE